MPVKSEFYTFEFFVNFNVSADVYKTNTNKNTKKHKIMKKYICTVCDWVYDPAVGDPDNGIAPGTAFEDIPDDWVCPVCGVGKDDFEVVEE